MGNIPGNTTPTSLQNLFTKYGNIESVRVLSHKNCGFINFDLVESAIAARDALLQNEVGAQGFNGARVGFAKIPPPTTTNNNVTKLNSNSSESNGSSSTSSFAMNNGDDSASLLKDATNNWQNDLFNIMVQFNISEEIARGYVKGNSFIYF